MKIRLIIDATINGVGYPTGTEIALDAATAIHLIRSGRAENPAAPPASSTFIEPTEPEEPGEDGGD